MKKVFRYIGVWLALLVLFVCTLTLTALIPNKWIKENVKESAEVLCEEKEYPIKKLLNRYIMFDNYADAIMINEAYSMDPAEPFYSAMVVRRSYIPGVTTEVLDEEVGDPEIAIYETQNLMNVVEGKNILSKQYAKYWHGYLIFLKPILMIFNWSEIQVLLFIITYTLAIILLYLIKKNFGLLQSACFLIIFLLIDFQYIFFSLEYTPVFILMLIVSILILVNPKWIKDKKMIYFITGILTCFFDFLTAPLITLGIPLILDLLLQEKNEKIEVKEMFKEIIINSLLWGLGYGSIWLAKFIIVDIFFNGNVIHAALEQVFHRTFDKDRDFEINLSNALQYNFNNCNNSVLIPLIVVEFILLINRKKNWKREKSEILKEWKSCLPYLLIAIMPFVWYAILEEHSVRHAIFTYRILSIFWIAILMVFCKLRKVLFK